MGFGVNGGRRGRRTSGNVGCLTVLLIVCFLPFYLIWKLYQFAWGKPQTQRGKILSVSGVSVGLLILIIIGSAAGGSSSPTPGAPSPVTSAASVLSQVSPTPSATHKAVAATQSPAPVTTSAAASSNSPAPVRTTQAPAATAAPPTTAAPVTIAPPTTAAPVAPTTAPPAAPSCYPTVASSGNCYEPGQFCPEADAGMSGIAGDGKAIRCELVSGRYHWE